MQLQSLEIKRRWPCRAIKILWRASKKGIDVDAKSILMLAIIYVGKHAQVKSFS
jgi:hypothetical protein